MVVVVGELFCKLMGWFWLEYVQGAELNFKNGSEMYAMNDSVNTVMK